MLRRLFTVAVGTLAVSGSTFAAEALPPAKPVASFGLLRPAAAETAKARAQAWLEKSGHYNAAAFNAVWADETRSVFDRTVDSLLAGSSEVKAAIETARNPALPAPTNAPMLLTDAKEDAFARSNLATAYAKALGGKRVYEESLDALKAVQPEFVVDPAQYFFYRAVAEHALLKKEEAVSTVVRLFDEVADVPDRYKNVAAMIFADMSQWSNDRKDLANIGRLMDNSGRRLDLARGDKKTQDIQKKILISLDEKIKEVENQCKGNCNGGGCPNGGNGQPNNTNTPSGPQQDSFGGGSSGDGRAIAEKLDKLGEEWGKLPPEERVRKMQAIAKDAPPKFKGLIESYYNRLNELNSTKP